MRIYPLTLLIFLTIISCTREFKKQAITLNTDTGETMEQDQDRLKYLVLGDSYTKDEGVDIALRAGCTRSGSDWLSRRL